MGAVAKRLLRRCPATAKMVNFLPILDDIAVIVGNRDLPTDLKRSVFHAFDRDIHPESPYIMVVCPNRPSPWQQSGGPDKNLHTP